MTSRRDWRLPTLEEALSLLKPTLRRDGGDPVFTDPRFILHGYKAIWTADGGPSGPAHWCVDFQNGHCDTLYHDPKGFVLPVRRVDLEATVFHDAEHT